MTRFSTTGVSGGGRSQGSLPHGRNPLAANGLILRGAVVATYVPIDGPPSAKRKVLHDDADIAGTYCDVIVYSRHPNFRNALFRSVPVVGDSGLHDGRVWAPRAARVNLAGGTLQRTGVDPVDLDGDHVLIQFLDDDLAQPVITGRAPHPRMGTGNEGLPEAGHRMRLKVVDGEPDFWKHHGSFYGVDDSGNFVVDTTRAHGGEFSDDGSEVPAQDAAHGNVIIRVGDDNTVTVQVGGGATLLLTGKDGATTMQLGDGARHVAVVEELQALYGVLKTWLETHVHPTGVGPSGPPAVLPAPDWDPAINSSKVSIPEG